MLKIPLTRCYELFQQGKLPKAVRVGERSIHINRRALERGLLEQRRTDQ